ncbi:hypothetical protein V8C86DRAFT_2498479 [Haematococcus lacustris]
MPRFHSAGVMDMSSLSGPSLLPRPPSQGLGQQLVRPGGVVILLPPPKPTPPCHDTAHADSQATSRPPCTAAGVHEPFPEGSTAHRSQGAVFSCSIHDPSAENHQQDGVRQNAPPDQLRQQQSQLQHLVGRKRLAAAEALLEAQWRAAHPTAATSSLGQQPELAPDNVGYRLLQHAGWREGSGLGSAGQGRVAPVAPVANKGTKGIGFDAGQGVQGRRQANAGEAAAEQQVHGLQEGRKAPPEPSAASLKIADLVAQELAGESMEAKVALHKAAAAAELEAARGRAIQRMLYTAFNDPFDGPGGDTANINPLRRNARLSAANPLLDSDEEGR